MNDCRIAKADVDGGCAFDAIKRRIHRFKTIVARRVWARLHIGLVDLNDIDTGSEKILDLRIDRRRIGESQLPAARIKIILRLLRHRIGPRHGDLGDALGMASQELDITHTDGMFALDRTDDARHRIGMA